MSRRAILALGIGQCVNWGVLYYAFAVLVVPVERELGVDTWVVTGAFSLALLMSAAGAPTVGRWADRDRGALVMQAGGVTAAVLLVAWAAIPTVSALYVTWLGLGLCMAATLYEPAFIVVGRAHLDPVARLRGLAIVTLLGGLASTVFLPLTSIVVGRYGWRPTVVVLGIALLASTGLTRFLVFRELPLRSSLPAATDADVASPGRPAFSRQVWFMATTFAATGLATAAFIANLVPALAERGIPPSVAAMLGGLIGLMQLPGRAFLLTGAFANAPSRLIMICLAAQAVGLEVVALTRSSLSIAGGLMLFTAGGGLLTLVRPHVVQRAFGVGQAGYLNGQLARGQQLGRAVGPIMIAWLADYIGYGVALALLGGVMACLCLSSLQLLND